MPYKTQTDPNIKPYMPPKGQVKTFSGSIEEIEAFYNNFDYKIKASNIFPQTQAGSSTGRYTIIVFYDK
jgi:hypothetical protein